MSVFMSDGDAQIMNTMNYFMSVSLLNPKARCRGCCWHGVSQVLLKKFSKDNDKACTMRNGIGMFLNSRCRSQTQEEINYCWNEMINWIESMRVNKKISISLHVASITVTNSMQLKKGYFFDFYYRDCMLNLNEKTTGRTEVENCQLKVRRVDLRSTFTKLAVVDQKRQKMRENNLQLQANYTNRTLLPGVQNDFTMVANLLSTRRANDFKV